MTTRLLVPAALAATCAAVLAAPGRPEAVRAAPTCDEIIGQTRFPFRGGGYRPVLGAAAVPPAYLPQVVETGSGPWTHWSKSGMVIRAGGGPVTVSVPVGWRRRAAIHWGNAGRPAATVTFPRCDGRSTVGYAFAGGFYLRAPSGCIPLLVRVGSRSQIVHFGLARRCG
jgi:hypothetical protein